MERSNSIVHEQIVILEQISSLLVKLGITKDFSERKAITDEVIYCAKMLGELDTIAKEE